jgi:NAD(P)H dehydrogenase (quinone)
MNVLLVYAHNEPSSFTASLLNLAQSTLNESGHQVTVSDLYGVGFNPVAEKYDFNQLDTGHFNYMEEQLRAANHDWAYSVDIVGELQKIQDADLILFYFPLWWSGPPAILKGWLDRVLTMGTAWDGEHIFSTGKYRGKVAGVAVAVGEPESYYNAKGVQKATVTQMLYPMLHGTLAFCGFNVLEPFVAHGLTVANEFAITGQLEAYREKLLKLETEPRFLYRF